MVHLPSGNIQLHNLCTDLQSSTVHISEYGHTYIRYRVCMFARVSSVCLRKEIERYYIYLTGVWMENHSRISHCIFA